MKNDCENVRVTCEFCGEIFEGNYEEAKGRFKEHVLNEHRSEFVKKYENLLQKRNELSWAAGYIFAVSAGCIETEDESI